MKKYNLYLAIPIFLLSPVISKAINPPTKENYQIYSSGFFGPYEKYQDDITLNFYMYTTSSFIDDIVTIWHSSYDGQGTLIETKNQTYTVSKSTNVHYFDITIPTKKYLDENGMKISVTISSNSTPTKRTSVSFMLYPMVEVDFDPCKTNHLTRNISVSIDNNKTSYIKETYSFDNYVDYFTNDLYYRLDLNQFKFTYSSPYPFSYKEAFLSFINPPEIISEFNGKPITLELSNLNNVITPCLKQKLYVNPKTLEMSLVHKNNYVETKYFYFPINHKADFINSQIMFAFLDCGYTSVNLKFTADCYCMTDMVGQCSNSEYCVVGETR